MLRTALRAPDHGRLHPWRVIEFPAGQREALADCFEQERRRREPLASSTDIRRAREHATRSPVLLAFVFSPRVAINVPIREQWMSAGAALGNLLNAAHLLGYGAMVLSGDRCFDSALLRQLGVGQEEFLAGFVSIGKVLEAPPPVQITLPGAVLSSWAPTEQEISKSPTQPGGD
jgi:nitroreductase